MEDFIKELGIRNPEPMFHRSGCFGQGLIDNPAHDAFKNAIPIAIRAYIEWEDGKCDNPDHATRLEDAFTKELIAIQFADHCRDCPLCQARVHEVFGVK
jgi:hypothetical protein